MMEYSGHLGFISSTVTVSVTKLGPVTSPQGPHPLPDLQHGGGKPKASNSIIRGVELLQEKNTKR